MNPDDPNYWPSVAAAIINDVQAAWIPGLNETGRTEPAHQFFERSHVQLLHDTGCTRQQALDYAAQWMSPAQVAKLDSDLDSYGVWP